MMGRAKRALQAGAQRVLGFDRYLVWFSRFKRETLRWDRNERDVLVLVDRLGPTDVVLDVGANVGIMTALLARAVPAGHVHAFEPMPDNARALRRACRAWIPHRLTVHQVAVGDAPGEVDMVMPVQSAVRMQGLAHVVRPGEEAPGDAAGDRFTVPLVRLDDVPELAGADVAAMKIDVENHEEQVLAGAMGLLARCRPVVYTELWDNEVRTRCFEALAALGYAPFVAESGGLVPYEPGRHHQHNFYLLPPEDPARGGPGPQRYRDGHRRG